MGDTTDPRTKRTYRKLAANYKLQCRLANRPCMHCAQPIDYSIEDTNEPGAFTVEHLKPLKLYPDLAEDPTNFGPAHRACNSSRGLGELKPTLGTTSRDW